MCVALPSNQADRADEPAKPMHLGYIDGLRGLAAVYVTLHHFCLWGTSGLPHWTRLLLGWTAFGHFAVAVFITLSGFCLMLPVNNSSDKKLRGGFRDYIKRRAWRILPPYYAALAFALVVTLVSPSGLEWLKNGHHADNYWLSNFSVGDIVSHLLVAHNLNRSWSGRLDMAMWSIATEWQIYFFFGLILLPVWQRVGSLMTVVLGFALGLLPHICLPVGGNFDWACPWYLGLFSLGMASAVIATSSRIWPQKWIAFLPWATLVFGVIYAGMKFLPHSQTASADDSHEWLKDTIAGIIASSVITYCALRSRSGTRSVLIDLLQSRIAVGVGTWSYSLYLIHCLVLQEMETLQHSFHLSSIVALYFRVLIGLPLAYVTAYLFFLVFERPFLRNQKPGGTKIKGSSADAEIARNAATSPAP